MKKIGTEYSLVNGISLDDVIKLIPNFDLLTIEFMQYVNNYWLCDVDLSKNIWNTKIFNSCDRFLCKFDYPCVFTNNGRFFASHIDWNIGIVNSIVIGGITENKYCSIIKMYRTDIDQQAIMDKIKEYENL